MVTEVIDRPDMSEFDPFGAEFRRDPFEYYAPLVTQSPGFIDMEGVPSAYVSSYAQAAAVLRDFKTYSSLKPKDLPGMDRIDFFNGQPVMNYSDPPDHLRRRKVVNAAFSPKRIERLGEAAGTFIDGLLDKAEASGAFDGVVDLCKPLANDVLLGSLMTVDEKDRYIFFDFLKTLSLLDKMRPGDPKPKPYLDAWAAGEDYCRRAVARARDEGSDSLVGLIAAGGEGGAITEAEMMAMLVVLFSGGMSTMAHAGAACLLNLAMHPDVAERVRADPAVAMPVLEESLRLYQPVMLVMRFAAADSELGGRPIPKGMPVYVMISAANHDPAKFPDPDRFDIDRDNLKDHLAFGQGMHTCIGNAITRLVMPMLVCKVLDRFPGLRLAEPGRALEWEARTPRARHLASLPLTFR